MYHGVEIDDCTSFLNYTFEKTSATIAQKFGDFDDDGTIRLQEGALTQDQMDDDIVAEMAAETWIDMNVLNSAGPKVAHGIGLMVSSTTTTRQSCWARLTPTVLKSSPRRGL